MKDYLKIGNLWEQLSFHGLVHLLVLPLTTLYELITSTIQQLLLPPSHLNQMDSGIDGDRLDRLVCNDGLHGDLKLKSEIKLRFRSSVSSETNSW